MGWRCALLLGLLGLAAGAPLSAADPPEPRTALRDCAQRAKSTSRGFEALHADCPALDSALAASGVAALLPADWKARISTRALTDLDVLTDRFTHRAAGSLPNPSSLQAIARRLEAPVESPSWWERLKTWLASWLDSDRNRWPGWLRFLHLSRGGALALVYGSAVLVVIAAVIVVVKELRAAGMLGPRRARPARLAVSPQSAAVTERAPITGDIDAAPEHLRPVILLRLLVTALARSHRLERDGVLTCRELITAARFDTPAQRELFANVALSAEQVLYGEPGRKPQILSDALLGNARGLLGQLAAAPAEQLAR